MTKQLDPFDLDRFMAGEDAITRGGERVKFGAYNSDASGTHQIIGWKRNRVSSWRGSGRWWGSSTDHPNDLTHMAPRVVKREVWIRRARQEMSWVTPWNTRDVISGHPREWLDDDDYYSGNEIGPVHTYDVEE